MDTTSEFISESDEKDLTDMWNLVPGPNPLPTDSVGNVECKEVAEPFDLEVLIDGSSSVGEEDFKKIKRFVTNVLQGFTVGPNNVQVGIVQFSGTTRTEFSLNKYKNYAELVVGIDAITYLKGLRNRRPTKVRLEWLKLFRNNKNWCCYHSCT